MMEVRKKLTFYSPGLLSLIGIAIIALILKLTFNKSDNCIELYYQIQDCWELPRNRTFIADFNYTSIIANKFNENQIAKQIDTAQKIMELPDIFSVVKVDISKASLNQLVKFIDLGLNNDLKSISFIADTLFYIRKMRRCQ